MKWLCLFLQLFYLYVYGLSILFLIYVYVYLLGNRKIKLHPFRKREDSTSSQKKRLKKRKVSVDEVDSHTGSFYLRLGALGEPERKEVAGFTCNELT